MYSLRPLRLVAILSLAPSSLAGQNLQPGHAIERELARGGSDEYRIQVEAGRFLRVVAEQLGADVTVAILDPQGNTVVEADRPNGAFGPEAVSFIAGVAGEYRVRVADPSGPAGRYRVHVSAPRAPGDADESRIQAERLLFQAAHSDAADTRETRLHAIELYRRAQALWHTLSDPYEEGLCFYGIAGRYSQLGDKDQSLASYSQALPLMRAAGDRSGEASTLNGLGAAYQRLDDNPKALDHFARALALFHDLGDRADEANTVHLTARLYSASGEPRKALDAFAQERTLRQSLGDHEGEADALNSMGNLQFTLGDWPRALELYSQSLPLYREAGDPGSVAVVMSNLASTYARMKQTQKALETYAGILKVSHEAGDRAREASTLGSMGKLQFALGDRAKALELSQQAAALHHELGDRDGESADLFSMGNIAEQSDEPRQGLAYLNQALPIARATGNRSRQAVILHAAALCESHLGEKQKALNSFEQALSLFRALHDLSAEAGALGNMGVIYRDLGDKAKALDYYNQALVIMRATGDRWDEATMLSNIAMVYDELDEHQKALEFDQQALPIRRAEGDRSGEAATLNNIGLVYSNLGDFHHALDYYTQAHSLAHDIKERFLEAGTLANMGRAYNELGDQAKAFDCFTQALPIRHALGDRAGEASTLNNLAGYYSERGEKQKALETYSAALPLNRAVGDRPGEAITLSNLGQIYNELGEKQKALGYYAQSLIVARAVGDRYLEAVTLNNFSGILKTTQPELAIFLAKQAVNLLQAIRRDNRGLDASLRASFEKSVGDIYRTLAGQLITRQRFGEAEEVLNLLKDKEAADFIRRDAVTDQLKPASLLDSERQALDRYEKIVNNIVAEGQAKSALVAKAANQTLSSEESQRSEQLDQDLAAANTVLLKYLDEQEKTFASGSGVAKRVNDLRESEGLQDALQALGPDVVAIYTLVLPDKYTALLISSGARKVYSTAIAEAELNRKIFAFRQQLQNPQSDPLPLARELYKIVFPEGLRQDLDAAGVKTIMWSIDSTLRYIPIAALHDGKQYVVTRFRNSLITPASLTRLTESSRAEWKGVGFGVSRAEGGFSALPSVPEELHRIFQQSQGDTAQQSQGDKARQSQGDKAQQSHGDKAPIPGRVRLDPDFTRETFKAAMQQPDKAVVHIATHFDSRPGAASNSYLLLGDGTELSLAEIEAMPRLFSGVDLLTLSACSTAFTNSSEDGREVDSFGTIAQRLGAKGVIASLWSVNDEATARLMETMYRIRQDRPELGKSEALREAQEQMVEGILKPDEGAGADRGIKTAAPKPAAGGWTHPYYWAPFILIGNWR